MSEAAAKRAVESQNKLLLAQIETETAQLAADVELRLAKLGFPREDKPFSPHITLARVKEYSPALQPKIAAIKERDFGTCEISSVLLKKSVLTPSGPIYTTLYQKNL